MQRQTDEAVLRNLKRRTKLYRSRHAALGVKMFFSVGFFLAAILPTPQAEPTYTAPAVELTCPPGWSIIDADCIRFFYAYLNFHDAADICYNYGGHLVVARDNFVDTAYVQALVQLEASTVESWWEGAYIDDINGRLRLDVGNIVYPFIGYHDNFQPDVQPYPQCSAMVSNYYSYLSPDAAGSNLRPCYEKRPFVCQINACPKNTFRCYTGYCLPYHYLCNGYDDCGDFSDEQSCPGLFFELFVGLTGSVGLNGYGSYKPHQWLLELHPAYRVQLIFTSFNTEGNSHFLEIWVGGLTLSHSKRIAVMSGHLFGDDLGPYYSDNGFMIVRFYSDSGVYPGGFSATWTAVPREYHTAILNATSVQQELTSDPNPLIGGLRNTWIIDSGSKWLIVFLKRLEVVCLPKGSFIDVFDGPSFKDPLLGTFTGNEHEDPYYLLSSQRYLLLHLYTPRGKATGHFKLGYSNKCEVVMETDYAKIKSPGWPVSFYPPVLTCTYRITSLSGGTFRIVVNEFMLSPGDTLTIYDGVDADGTELARSNNATGDAGTIQMSFNSPSESVFFSFETDGSGGQTGFLILMSTGCPLLNFTGDTIADPLTNTFGDVITVECPPGFFLAQDSFDSLLMVNITCKTNKWDQCQTPNCERVTCGKPPVLANGFVFGSNGTSYMDFVEYQCEEGYNFTGANVIQCEATGNWSTPQPCQSVDLSDCAVPTDAPDASTGSFQPSGPIFRPNDIVEYTCNEGYEFVLGPYRQCQNAQWLPDTSPTLECQPVTCFLPIVPNGLTWDVMPVQFPDTAVHQCISGDNITVSCTADRSLSPTPVCPVSAADAGLLCGPPTICFENSTSTCSNTTGCVCVEGYTGTLCNEMINGCDSDPCQYGGICTDEGLGQFTCNCTADWTGDTCETPVDYCTSQTCSSAGTCHNVIGGFYCQCDPERTGNECEQSTVCNPNPCLASGTCFEGFNKAAKCQCEFGRTGKYCELAAIPCNDPFTCYNGGKCIKVLDDFICRCKSGFSGGRCENSTLSTCNETCEANGGTCVYYPYGFFCRCPVGFAGQNCDRELNRDYDIKFHSHDGTGQAYLLTPFPVHSSSFSVGVWVRFDTSTDPDPEGVFLTLYETHAPYIDTHSPYDGVRRLLQFDHEKVLISLDPNASDMMKFYNQSNGERHIINDGKWYYVMVVYDGSDGHLVVYANNVVVCEVPNYSTGCIFYNGWAVAGALFDPISGYEEGLEGYVSQVMAWNRSLTEEENVDLTQSVDAVVPDKVLDWTNWLLMAGSWRVTPSMAGTWLPPPPPGEPKPQILNCPTEPIAKKSSERRTAVTWDELEAENTASQIVCIYQPGDAFLWGKSTNVCIAKNAIGDVDICTFDIFVRKFDCSDPPIFEDSQWFCQDVSYPEPFATQVRVCHVDCPPGHQPSAPAPNYYQCDLRGSFNVKNILKIGRIPPCGLVGETYYNLTFSVVYPAIVICNQVRNAGGISEALRVKISDLDLQPPDALCRDPDCLDLDIKIYCPPNGPLVLIVRFTNTRTNIVYKGTMYANALDLVQALFFMEGFLDDDDVTNGTADLKTITCDKVPSCSEGFGYVNGSCVKCARGQYSPGYSQPCRLCELGEYQDDVGEDECEFCPYGYTTIYRGSTSSSDCIPICYEGQFYDVDRLQCRPCETGFYQDEPGQACCKPCRVHMITTGVGANSSYDCIDTCPDGFELQYGTTICRPCPFGFYRTQGVHDRCIPCPTGYTTQYAGASREEDCSLPECHPGYFVDDDECKVCPIGQYQPNPRKTECEECPPYYTTIIPGRTSYTDCKFFCSYGKEEHPPGSKLCRLCRNGFYKDNEQPGARCTRCVGTLVTPFLGAVSSSDCSIYGCPAGSRPNDQNNGCVPCIKGTYQPDPYKIDCLPCPGGKSTREEGADKLELCEKYCPAGQERQEYYDYCVQCRRGYYKDDSGDLFDNCTRCEEDYITPFKGSTSSADCSVRNCTAGYKTDRASGQCVPCPIDTYLDEWWAYDCKPCPPGKTTDGPATGSAELCLLVCPEGLEDRGDTCKPCRVGYWKSREGATSCHPCSGGLITEDEGSTDPAQCDREDCGPGTFLNYNLECRPCPRGQFQPRPRMTECEQCPDQLTTFGEGKTKYTDCVPICPHGYEWSFYSGSCVPCTRGYYRNQGLHDECQRCPIDRVTAYDRATHIDNCTLANCSAGQYWEPDNVCVQCPRGYYQPTKWQTTCIPCPFDSTTSDVSSTSPSKCFPKCLRGWYMVGNGSCVICPRGYYRDPAEGYACLPCPDGLMTSGPGSGFQTDCNFADCGPGYKQVGSTCEPCEDGTYQPEKWQSYCIECDENYRTYKRGATSKSECKRILTCTDADEVCLTALDGGQCVAYKDPDGYRRFRCECRPGWNGTHPDCIHQCEQTYCAGNGRCSREDDDSPYCTCYEDYHGKQCQLKGQAASNNNVIYIIVGVVLGSIVLVAVLVVCCRASFGKNRRSKKVVASFPYVPKLYDPALSSLALRYTGRPVGQPQNVYGPQPFAAQPTSHAAQSTPLFVNVVGAKPALNTTIPGYPQLADNNVITINTNSTPHVPVIQPQSALGNLLYEDVDGPVHNRFIMQVAPDDFHDFHQYDHRQVTANFLPE